MKFKFWFFRHYWWVLLCLLLSVIAIMAYVGVKLDFKVISALLGIFLPSIYFVQKQRLEEAKLFREIFAECNQRYDDMNDKINNIMRGDHSSPLDESETNLLDDYFNLCAEEYLYFQQGYIYPDVWAAWLNGMKAILKDKRISQHWLKEKVAGSFYGLPL